jgi:Trk K+ transport system NAD-binding subunit
MDEPISDPPLAPARASCYDSRVQNQTTPTPSPEPPPAARRDHVIICGLGNLGIRIYHQLDLMGVPLVVVDAHPEPQFVTRVRAGHDRLIVGDARQPEVLDRAGLATARALITTFDDDLVNLETVLDATRRRPDLRVVMRFFNIDLAPSIGAALPNVTVLSLSALASPAFVVAATDPFAHNAMIMDDGVITVDEILVPRPTTLADLIIGTGVVLAWQHGDEAPHLFPTPGESVAPGDRVIVIGPEHPHRPALDPAAAGPARRRPASRPRLTGMQTLLRSLDRALYITLVLLAAVIVFSVGLFALAKGLTPLDALFLVFTVISATGVGGSGVQNDPDWIKIYVIALMVIGTAVLTILYAFVTNYIVSIKLSGLLGQQPVTMENHIVLCGLGTVGYRVLTGLQERGEAVAVLEKNEANRFLPLVRSGKNVHIVMGDSSLRESLNLVNVASARCIIAATSDDMANIQTGLNARQVNPRIRVILRTFDQHTAQQVARTFGFEVALSASALAAPTFVSAALGQTVGLAFPLGDATLAVARLRVAPGSAAAGLGLGMLLEGLGARVLSYSPPGEPPRYRPDPAALLRPGAVLVVVAADAALRVLTARLAAPERSEKLEVRN